MINIIRGWYFAWNCNRMNRIKDFIIESFIDKTLSMLQTAGYKIFTAKWIASWTKPFS